MLIAVTAITAAVAIAHLILPEKGWTLAFVNAAFKVPLLVLDLYLYVYDYKREDRHELVLVPEENVLHEPLVEELNCTPLTGVSVAK